MQKWLIITGFFLILLGLCLPFILRSGLGHLPGDFFIKRGNFSFYFPLTSGIILSLVLTLILWLFNK